MDHPGDSGLSSADGAAAAGGMATRNGPPQPDADGQGLVLVFGAFALLAAQRRLEREGSIIPLGNKAFGVLRTLVERAGQVVEKAELLRQAGIDNEDSLRFHIAALRRTLGEGSYIANVSGRGYSFVAPVARAAHESPPASGQPSTRLLPP